MNKAAYICLPLAILNLHSSNAKNKNSPNVIFIIADDLNDWIEGYNGHPQAVTPHLKALMDRGIYFTNAHSNNPICGPSRASMLTGLYPHTTGYFGYNQQANHFRNFDKLREAKTMMEHFYDQGYNVYGTGKIFHNGHEDNSVWKTRDTLPAFGVDSSFGPFAWDGSTKRGDWDHALGRAHPAILNNPDEIRGWNNSFGSLANIPSYPPNAKNGSPGHNGWICYGKPFKYIHDYDRDKMPDELSVDYAKRIINADHNQPFFLAIGFNRPHTPLHAPQKYFDLYPIEDVTMPLFKEDELKHCALSLWNPNQTWTNAGFSTYDFLVNHSKPDMLKKYIQAYLANVSFLDEQVGAVLNILEDSKYVYNTIIVFTSDHGYHLGQKNYVFKASLWEPSSRVPLIIYIPGKGKGGSHISHPVSLIDIYPTLIDLCGLPEQPNHQTNGLTLDGFSLLPFMVNPSSRNWYGPEFALISVAGNEPLEINEPGKPKEQFFSLRTIQYRYTLCPNGEEELYDHYIDPNEWHNLAHDPENKDIRNSLKRSLHTFLINDK